MSQPTLPCRFPGEYRVNKGLEPSAQGSNMSKPAWIVNKPAVVSEVIDGELVVMNLATGNYFSSAGSGARLWARLEHGASADGLVAILVAHHDVDVDTASADVSRYLAALLADGLVREYGEALPSLPLEPAHAREPYEAPAMQGYSDMRDLLMLDPIHDVAEEGWPSRPAEDLKQAG